MNTGVGNLLTSLPVHAKLQCICRSGGFVIVGNSNNFCKKSWILKHVNTKHFPCKQCGDCCRLLDLMPNMVKYDRGDGCCKFLDNNRCKVYNLRPLLCRSEYLYDTLFSNIDKKTFIELIKGKCFEVSNIYGKRKIS